MYCKAEVVETISFLREKSPYLFLDEKRGFFVKTDLINKFIHTDDNLSAVYNVMFHE